MTKYFLAFVSILLTVQAWAATQRACEDLFASKRKRVFTPVKRLKTYIPASRDRAIVYDFIKPVGGRHVFVLLHGLGDDMNKVEGLAKLLSRSGYGVLRVDLHGHGRSLLEHISRYQSLPADLGNRVAVDDIRGLLLKLGIEEVSIAGHSRGGGVTYELAQELMTNTDVHVRSIHMIAPYVQRVDKFFADYFKSTSFIVDETSQALKSSGVDTGVVNSIFAPVYRLTWIMTERIRLYKDAFKRLLTWDFSKDLFLDPILDKWMRVSFRKYFVKHYGTSEDQLSDEQKQMVDVRVNVAIKVTKDLRGLDLLDRTVDLKGPLPPTQVIGGQNDKLVVAAMLRDFSTRLSSEGFPNELVLLEGENADHHLQEKMADEVHANIMAFMQEKGAPRPVKEVAN